MLNTTAGRPRAGSAPVSHIPRSSEAPPAAPVSRSVRDGTVALELQLPDARLPGPLLRLLQAEAQAQTHAHTQTQTQIQLELQTQLTTREAHSTPAHSDPLAAFQALGPDLQMVVLRYLPLQELIEMLSPRLDLEARTHPRVRDLTTAMHYRNRSVAVEWDALERWEESRIAYSNVASPCHEGRAIAACQIGSVAALCMLPLVVGVLMMVGSRMAEPTFSTIGGVSAVLGAAALLAIVRHVRRRCRAHAEHVLAERLAVAAVQRAEVGRSLLQLELHRFQRAEPAGVRMVVREGEDSPPSAEVKRPDPAGHVPAATPLAAARLGLGPAAT